jgi:hypothetical protein
MSVAEASAALGAPLHTADGEPAEPSCDYLYPASGHDGISLMVQEGRITSIDVAKPGIETRSGIRVGDTTSRLKQVFGSQLEIEPHHYDDQGFYYFVWEPDKKHGVKFEIANDRVVDILAGDQTIRLVEGCA